MAKKRCRGHSAARATRRVILGLCCALGAVVIGIVALFVLPGRPSWDASTPLQAGDLVAGDHRAGDEMRDAANHEEGMWVWEDMILYFTGTPLRLTGAEILSAHRAGPRGLRVGDSLEDLYRVIPVTAYEEPPEEYVLLYAAGMLPGGLPKEPYAVIVPSGDALLARMAARMEDGAFAICDVYINPDTGLIQRIRWETGADDDLWERLM